MNLVCVGDCGVDRYIDAGVDRAGGITLNFAVHARRCFPPDATITVITALGNDRDADLVLEALEHAGLASCVTRRRGATPVQHIVREPSGERRFAGYAEGVLRDYRLGTREREIIAGCDLLMTPVFAQVLGLFDSVMASLTRGLRAVDFSDLADFPDPVAFVRTCAARLDVGFFGLDGAQTPLIEALGALARDMGRLFVVTLGAGGSLAFDGASRVACPAAAVDQVVDTTGAGDSFAAGFLGEYCRSRDVLRALERGSREAARTVQHLGGFDVGLTSPGGPA